MPEETEVDRAARIFCRRYGADARREAEIRIEELGRFGDYETRDLWIRIGKAIEKLLKEKKAGHG